MSNKQAQASKKMYLANLMAVMANGDVVHLDTTKVMIVDIKTSKPLFKPKEKK